MTNAAPVRDRRTGADCHGLRQRDQALRATTPTGESGTRFGAVL